MRPSRTPLFDQLRRSWTLARLANRPEAEGEGERVGRRLLTRRDALATTTVLAARGAIAAPPIPISKRTGPRVVVVGAGLAGLAAASELAAAGLRPRIFEAAGRPGGRVLTAKDVVGPGLVTELGGEFIDARHVDLIALVQKLGLELVDVRKVADEGLTRDAFFFDGVHHGGDRAVEALRPLVGRIEDDQEDVGQPAEFRDNPDARDYDAMSISEYLDDAGAKGWIRKLIETAFLCECGLDCDQLSALNLVWMMNTHALADEFEVFADHDERWRVRGGNFQVVEALAKALARPVEFGHGLEAIRGGGRDDGFRLDFAVANGKGVAVEADFVVIALPFSVLRKVAIQVELPPLKRRSIAELGYGQNAKLVVGFRRRVWRDSGYAGGAYSDEPFQTAWDNGRRQPGEAGGLTLFPGGAGGIALGAGTAADQARRLLPGVDRAFPGAAAAFNGRVERALWPTRPLALGSYSCYKIGQLTTIAGEEGTPVGRLFFAGEHCLFGDSGFMNSALVSGKKAARALVALAKGG